MKNVELIFSHFITRPDPIYFYAVPIDLYVDLIIFVRHGKIGRSDMTNKLSPELT